MEKITDPTLSASSHHKYLVTLGMLWITFEIVTILTALKTFSIGPVVFSVAILAYPFVYIMSDIFTEVYGYRVTRRIVWTGFACIIIATSLTSLYSIVPPSTSFAEINDAFVYIFQASPLVAIVAIIAFFFGEITNSFTVAKLKLVTQGKNLWLRLVGSTVVGQIVDNGIFFTGVFLLAGFYAPNELVPLIVSSTVFCVVWEVIALPITYRVIAFIKRKEGLDTYDKGTDFNPFSLKS